MLAYAYVPITLTFGGNLNVMSGLQFLNVFELRVEFKISVLENLTIVRLVTFQKPISLVIEKCPSPKNSISLILSICE